MAKMPTMDELAKSVANEALDSFVLDGKTLREWVEQVKASRWISVKDRLPEESDGTVLVCFPNESPYNLKEHFVNAKHDQRVTTAHYSQYSKTWYIGDMCGVGDIDPTHWMPLPEPPKEES